MRVCFGEYTLDTESRQLLKDGAERRLSPKGFHLLLLLLESRPRAVSKTELHEQLWPDTFVSDATVTSLVAEVRGALGEKAGRGRFVRTVHRFGYAFMGVATEAPAESSREGRARCRGANTHSSTIPCGAALATPRTDRLERTTMRVPNT